MLMQNLSNDFKKYVFDFFKNNKLNNMQKHLNQTNIIKSNNFSIAILHYLGDFSKMKPGQILCVGTGKGLN